MPKWIYQRKFLPIIIIAAAVIIFGLLLFYKLYKPKVTSKIKPIDVEVIKVEPRQITPQVVLIGSVQSPRFAKLEAAVTAYVSATPFLSGSEVKKGDIVIYLDDRDARNTYRERQGLVDDIKAQLQAEAKRYEIDLQSYEHEKKVYELVKRDTERIRTLATKNYVSASELDSAIRKLRNEALVIARRRLALENYKNRIGQLNAKLSQAEAQRDQALLDLQRTKIVAPFSGRLINLHVSVGDRVNPGEQLAEIYDVSALEINAQVPNRYVDRIREAMANEAVITAQTEAYGKPLTLRLIRLGSQIRQGRGAIDAIFVLADNKTYLPIGLSLQVIVNLLPVSEAITVPPGAIYNNDRVYKVVDNQLVATPITVMGNRTALNGNRVMIIKSKELKAGDLIAITNLPSALTGTKVNPIYEKKPN